MNNYCGNKDPFVFIACAPCDREAAARLAEALAKKVRVYLADAFGKKERRALEKAALLLPVLSAASLAAMEEVTGFAAAKNKALLPIFLEKVELPAGLRLLLGGTQRINRGDYETQEDFERALCGAPVLDALEVSPEQKRAGRRTLIATACASAAALLLALLLILQPFSALRISRNSTLGQLGLSGDPKRITSVAVYGGELADGFEDGGVYEAYVSVVNNPSVGGLYLPGADKVASIGTLSDLSDFSQLKNLEELALAGNAINDPSPLFSLKKLKKLDLSMQNHVVSEAERMNAADIQPITLSLDGISALEQLETLYLCWNSWPEDGSVPAWMAELEQMPAFHTLVLDRGAEVLPALLGKVSYDIVLLGDEAGSYDELRSVAADPDCHSIHLMQGSEIVIPALEEWVLPQNVMLGGVDVTIRIEGTLHVRGWVECGLTSISNNGTIIVEDGGSFIGGMSSVENYGRFVVEAGGLHLIERGVEFWQRGGSYVNNGTLIIGWGGQFHYDGGSAENNGRIIVEKNDALQLPTPTWMEDKLATARRFSGSGSLSYEELTGQW